jgi:hypothetical protein
MRQVANSATVIYPLRIRFCRYSQVTSGACQLNFAMRRKRKEGRLTVNSTTTFQFFKICFSTSFSLFSRKE